MGYYNLVLLTNLCQFTTVNIFEVVCAHLFVAADGIS